MKMHKRLAAIVLILVTVVSLAMGSFALPLDYSGKDGDFYDPVPVTPTPVTPALVPVIDVTPEERPAVFRVTFVDGKDFNLIAQPGTNVLASGNVQFSMKPGLIPEKYIPEVVFDGEGYAYNWAVLNLKGEYVPVDFTTYQVLGDTKLYLIPREAEVSGVCPRNMLCPIWKFNDASTMAWYHDGVHYCIENGLMVGIGDNKFAPQGTTTRAMIVTILWRMEKSPVVNFAMTFEDVADDMWYTEAIRWAQSTGVVKGYSEAEFGPMDEITREQLATILFNYASYKGEDFSESLKNALIFADADKISKWAYNPVCWCFVKEIVNGKGNNIFDPKGLATRAEAATMIYRFCILLGR